MLAILPDFLAEDLVRFDIFLYDGLMADFFYFFFGGLKRGHRRSAFTFGKLVITMRIFEGIVVDGGDEVANGNVAIFGYQFGQFWQI